MYKLWIATYKELLLLKRDLGGLVILFIMPLVLVITVTLIQDSSFGGNSNVKIPVVIVDNDKDVLSQAIISNLEGNNSFEIVTHHKKRLIDETLANDLVLKGEYQLAIVLPNDLTEKLNTKVAQNVANILSQVSGEDVTVSNGITTNKPQEIKLFFDPAAQLSFKNGVKNAIDKMVSKLETEAIYSAFQEELAIEGQMFNSDNLFVFSEVNPLKEKVGALPNSVQHNVPAWALFAIFFIIIPLSINVVGEKNQGTFVRLKTSPISFAITIGGKVLVYLSVCILQFFLMLLVGIYLFPHIGLPEFTVNGNYILLFVMALFSGLAAIGLGVLLGTIANTPEQSAPFGATLVVILAAIGGVWIPVFIMPDVLQIIAKMSPMNWALNGFYDVIIRNGNIIDILPELSALGVFFIVMMLISIYYDKIKNAI